MRSWLCVTLLAAAIAPCGPSFAETAPPATAAAAAPIPLNLDQLADISAGQDTTIALTNQALTAVNLGNSITAGTVRSGDINFNAQALANFTGIGNFVINTGANNNLQGSLSVTVVPAPAIGR